MNCLFRISSKGAAREDEIVSGHAIDRELALLARVEGQVFEDFNHPADLHAFGQKTRERWALLGDVADADKPAAYIAAPSSASVK